MSTVAAEIAVGMNHAESGAGTVWCDRAERIILGLLRSNEFFHVNDAWGAGLDVPDNGPRAIGPIIMRLAKSGCMVKIEKTPSKKARDLPMWKWRSLLFRSDGARA